MKKNIIMQDHIDLRSKNLNGFHSISNILLLTQIVEFIFTLVLYNTKIIGFFIFMPIHTILIQIVTGLYFITCNEIVSAVNFSLDIVNNYNKDSQNSDESALEFMKQRCKIATDLMNNKTNGTQLLISFLSAIVYHLYLILTYTQIKNILWLIYIIPTSIIVLLVLIVAVDLMEDYNKAQKEFKKEWIEE